MAVEEPRHEERAPDGSINLYPLDIGSVIAGGKVDPVMEVVNYRPVRALGGFTHGAIRARAGSEGQLPGRATAHAGASLAAGVAADQGMMR